MIFKTLISPIELNKLFNANQDLLIADCRFSLQDEDEGLCGYYGGHIPGAVYVHLNQDLSNPVVPGKTGRHPLLDPDEAAAFFSRIGIGKNTQVVVYDEKAGAIAARMWWMLRWLGHEAAAVLEGGISRWKQEGFPLEKETPEISAAEFIPDIQKGRIAELNEIIHIVKNQSDILVDARAAERYRGESEPFDYKPGHIPTAISAPFMENVDEFGRMKPKAWLYERFKPFYKKGIPVFYCGSGVTSCHNILACVHSGHKEPRLYPGSYSEWIADPARPAAVIKNNQADD